MGREEQARAQEERRTTGENRGSSSTSLCIDWAIASLTFVQRPIMKVAAFSYVFRLGSESRPDQATRFQCLVVMRIQWTPMGQGKSEEHPSYGESTVLE
ncbi:hypothetical protein Taro_008971 [Colocasia esculenta]|uniref:Uncharacterized protein n=1 Tax=Colocasia esculenta TaxID=4460 RepID=A0A843U2Q0_COLES|nr:hypothetical protein [Colocasia esculenta]